MFCSGTQVPERQPHFRRRAGALGDDALLIPARDFPVRAAAPQELSGKTLFIDGLDEVQSRKVGFAGSFR